MGSVSNGFGVIGSRELSLNRNIYDLLVNYNVVDRSEILNIHKYIMVRNNMK